MHSAIYTPTCLSLFFCPQIVTKRIKMQGMIVGDYMADQELVHEFRTNMTKYVQEGKVKVVEHMTEGIENAGHAFIEVGAARLGGPCCCNAAAAVATTCDLILAACLGS